LSNDMTAQSNSVKKTRDSNIELLRIIAMLLLVAHHYVVNSGLLQAVNNAPISVDGALTLLLGQFGKPLINSFVMITCYFMCTANITFKKFLKLLLQIMFYRIVILIVFAIVNGDILSLSFVKRFALVLIPIQSIGTGFTNAFLMFYLLIPFLNRMVRGLSESQHVLLLVLFGFLYCILGIFHSIEFNYVSWFAVLYFFAAYIRFYRKKWFSDIKATGIMTAVVAALSSLSIIAIYVLNAKTKFSLPLYAFVVDSNNLLPTALGISLFMLFMNLKIGQSRLINTVASTTFGVLLIHTNAQVRGLLWYDWFKCAESYTKYPLSVVYMIGVVVLVFVVCSAIDYLRIKLIEEPFFKRMDKKLDSISESFSKRLDTLFTKLGIGSTN